MLIPRFAQDDKQVQIPPFARDDESCLTSVPPQKDTAEGAKDSLAVRVER